MWSTDSHVTQSGREARFPLLQSLLESLSITSHRPKREYSRQYYQSLDSAECGSRKSAEVIIPMLLGMLQPTSVIDVGCGIGSWLAVFQKYGVADFMGVDLDDVDRDLLLINHENFKPFDLRHPLGIDRRFDLVLCLEVAGYLSEEEAPVLIDSLTRLGSVILFSAPIPFQGGPNQINLQWPEYWAEQFEARGYRTVDCIRRSIWKNPNVAWWFAQNTLLYVREDAIEQIPRLQEASKRTSREQLAVVHPRQLLQRESLEDLSLKKVLHLLPKLVLRAISRRMRFR